MHISTAVEQSYMYTSGATEMGRGERSNPFPTMKTPGVGTYNIYKEVKEPKKRSHRSPDDAEDVNVPTYMLKDKIHPIPKHFKKSKKKVEDPKTHDVKEVWTFVPPDLKPLHEWSTKIHAVVEHAREQPEGWT